MTVIQSGLTPADQSDKPKNNFETALFNAGNAQPFDKTKIRGPSIPLPYQNVQAPNNGSITYTPLGTDKKVTVSEQSDPALYKQLLAQYQTSQNEEATSKGIAQSNTDGYETADATTVAPGLANYKAIGSVDEMGPGLIRYETQAGDKVVVSKDQTPELFDQVSGDYTKLIAINQSEADGYRLAGPNETGSMQIVGAPEEVGPGLIRYQTYSGEKIIVSQDETPALYAQAVNESKGIANAPGASDTNYIDNSQYGAGAKAWDKIVGNTGSTPTQEEQDLNRPIAAAQMLSANWDAWGLHGAPIDFANPPTSLPPEAQAVLKYVSSSPSLMAALDAGSGSRTDNVITRANVDQFVSKAQGDLSSASSAYSKYLTSNTGDKGGIALATAKSAAILMANQSLAAASGSAMNPGNNQRENFGAIRQDNLQALASDTALSTDLTGAAGLWSRPGMLHALDIGGDDPATYHADGVVLAKNIGAWLTSVAPGSDNAALAFLDGAATRSASADVDTSKLTADVLANPQNYDGKTKAAVLTQLTDAQTRLTISNYEQNDTGLYDKYTAPNEGLNPNSDKVSAQLQNSINQLMADPDVQSFLASSRGPGLQDLVNSDPDLKLAVQSFSANDMASGKVLNDALSAKGSDGKPVTVGVGLQNAANEMTIANLALGGDGKLDFAAIAQKAGQVDTITSYYKNELVSGQAFKDMLASGMDPTAAASSFAASTASAQAFLGASASPDDAAKLQVNFNEILTDTLVNSADGDTLNVTLGDGSGNFDEAKVSAAITSAAQADPTLFTAADGSKIDPAQVVSMLRSLWDSGRQGEKITEALPKAIDGLNLGSVSDAYKQGLLHIGSAVLAGGVLIARSSTGSNTPTADANRVAAGLQFAGLLMEGGTKYAKEAGYGITWSVDNNVPDGIGQSPRTISSGKGPLTPQNIKDMGNVGKVVGASGSFISGVLGIMSGVNGLTHGDPIGGSISLTSGILGSSAAVSSLIEGGAGFLGFDDIAAAAGAIGGVLGGAAAVVGGIASIFVPFILADKRGKAQDAFYGELVPVLKQYGLTGGPTEPGDYPQDPLPAITT